MQWICTAKVPLASMKLVKGLAHARGDVGYMDRCRAYCDPRPNQWNSCDELCSNASGEVIEFGNSTFGLCTP